MVLNEGVQPFFGVHRMMPVQKPEISAKAALSFDRLYLVLVKYSLIWLLPSLPDTPIYSQ